MTPAFYAIAAGHVAIYSFALESSRAAWLAIGSERRAFTPSPEALESMADKESGFWRAMVKPVLSYPENRIWYPYRHAIPGGIWGASQ